jgi:hypothetical protein
MDDTTSAKSSGGWTIAALTAGLALVSACVIIPQIDANGRMAYEHQRLMADLDQINRQKAVNEEFLAKLDSDPQLAQRLAQRQMGLLREGESLLPYKTTSPGTAAAEMSPFTLVHIPPPVAPPPYRPAGGLIGQWLLDSHIRLYCLAVGLYLVAMGLVLGSNDKRDPRLGT